MSLSQDEFEEFMCRISLGDVGAADVLFAELFDSYPRRHVPTIAAEELEALVGLVLRDPHLKSTKLSRVVDYFVGVLLRDPMLIDVDLLSSLDGSQSDRQAAIGVIGRHASFWTDRVIAVEQSDLDDVVSALLVLCAAGHTTPEIQAGASKLLLRVSPADERWYGTFLACHRCLCPTQSWHDLMTRLLAILDASGNESHGISPPPRVVVLVEMLRYTERRDEIYDELRGFDLRSATEEALRLPAELQVELFSEIVDDMNRRGLWGESVALVEINYLLHAMGGENVPRPEFVAERTLITYRTGGSPLTGWVPEPITPAYQLALRRIFGCPLLWNIENNLMEIYGLPNTRAEFAAWLAGLTVADTANEQSPPQ